MNTSQAIVSLALAAGLSGAACRSVMLQPTEISEGAVVLAVPVVPQDELYECGLASISALCEFHGLSVPAEERAILVSTASRKQGLSGADLRAALEAAGFDVFIFPGALDHGVSGLMYHVDRGRPVLVMISMEPDANHYSLLRGYDSKHENVFLLDPRRGNLVLPWDFFDAAWRSTGRFTLLAIPHAMTATLETT